MKILLGFEFYIILASCFQVDKTTSSYVRAGTIVSAASLDHSNIGTVAVSQQLELTTSISASTSSSNGNTNNGVNNQTKPHNLSTTWNNTTTGSSSSSSTTTTTTVATTTTTTTTHDPNSDLDDGPVSPPIGNQDNSTNKVPNKDDLDKIANKNKNSTNDSRSGSYDRVNAELSLLWYSIFMVYVSFIKLIYHNVAIIKRNLTEPGILMIFGMIWELISRQINSSLAVGPRFNSRIFFYLFLPSTVLEAASVLSNKWLLLNLLPILIHSIIGTILYGSAISFTIYSMSRQDLFSITSSNNSITMQTSAAFSSATIRNQSSLMSIIGSSTPETTDHFSTSMLLADDSNLIDKDFFYEKGYVIDRSMIEVNNLTLADCLMFGSILSSVDSTTILGTFSMFQVNEKLHYLVLGESLMNNAVVLIVFNLLLDFLNTTRLTVVKIYIAIIQFFITIIGSIFIGLLLASIALISVRLIKRFQVPSALTSYQNQCLAIIETLLIVKLAYLTYTLGSLSGLSSIISLATFGVLQDQYIRFNLNLRSQITFRQVILATKTMGFSLVYPLLGMLLVDVAYADQNIYHHHHSTTNISPTSNNMNTESPSIKLTTTLSTQGSIYWNFKFISVIIVISIAYRFAIVIFLSTFCNLVTSRKLKVRFKEQLLMAYGGLKGPLAVALVHRLVEHDEYRDRLLRNKHFFMYTILFITTLSVIFKGAFIRPLVEKLQISLDYPKLTNHKIILFNTINIKVIECITQSVNNMIGHSKSPYERLFDYNETRIKPWLARDGSDTNWLSTFYDNFLLDETLDSNCFYRSTNNEEPITKTFWSKSNNVAQKDTNQMNIDLERNIIKTRRNNSQDKSFKLNTIDEQGGFIDDDDLTRLRLRTSARGSDDLNVSLGKSKTFVVKPDELALKQKSNTLKDSVMLDLKLLEDREARKHQRSKHKKIKPSSTTSGFIKMLNDMSRHGDAYDYDKTKANDEFQQIESSSDKEVYFAELNKQLNIRRQDKRNPSLKNSMIDNQKQILANRLASHRLNGSSREDRGTISKTFEGNDLILSETSYTDVKDVSKVSKRPNRHRSRIVYDNNMRLGNSNKLTSSSD